jgi:hypothetical protein
MVTVSGGHIGSLKVDGLHRNSNGGYGVAVTGGTIDNFDTVGLVTEANSGTNWHNAGGTIANNITTGGTFAIRTGPPNLWDGLMAYWRMQETSGTTVVDQLGNFPLTAAVAITNGGSSPISGQVSAAFGGSQIYKSADTGGTNQLLVQCGQLAQPSTVMGWFYVSSLSSSQMLAARGEATVASDWVFLYFQTTGAKLEASNGNTGKTDSTSSLSANTWYHAALVTDPFGQLGGGSKFYMYLNGALQGSASWTVPTAPVANDPFTLGANWSGSAIQFPMTGSAALCAWGVWAVPLNAYQIGLAYNGGTGVHLM